MTVTVTVTVSSPLPVLIVAEDFGGTTYFPGASSGDGWAGHPAMSAVYVDPATAAAMYHPAFIQHPALAQVTHLSTRQVATEQCPTVQ